MSYTISPSEDGKYIELKVVGTITRQLATQYNIEAHVLGKELGINRFLLDFTECRNTDTVMRHYNFVNTDMQDERINRNAHIVMLTSPGDRSHDFIEVLLKNAGIDATIFRDRDAAMWHLLSD